MSDVRDVNNTISGSISANFTQLPCDRGIFNGPRGLHQFQLSPGSARAVCSFCGVLGPSPDFNVGLDSSSKG